jgi:hypothetical protein
MTAELPGGPVPDLRADEVVPASEKSLNLTGMKVRSTLHKRDLSRQAVARRSRVRAAREEQDTMVGE